MTAFTEGLFAFAAIITAITVVGGGLWKLYGLTKRIEETIGVDREGKTLAERVTDAAEALGDHVRQTDSVLGKVDRRIEKLEEAFYPADGDSLVKRVDLVETDLVGLRGQLVKVGAKVDTLSDLLRQDINERSN